MNKQKQQSPDIISGSMLHKFVADYNLYDIRQQVYIKTLRSHIGEMERRISMMIPKAETKLIRRSLRQEALIDDLKAKIDNLKQINEIFLSRVC